ncbi:RNA polymerase sigma factor [Ktedonobacter sp. SOSP1-52]|uniref:RNA polymerase sigma factor n=1 Tax=Ktedonobacter sp. SOSP1-52 TaxID=2778366 RepID=UPI0019165477|nr:sigma-70 family RNA polymerase sigma factor [Ktedonobacter sp. SOSP1-52]GHO69157.1 RNA polymerase sigma factor [Ktedonobacter sp. SOSP1-52]
MQAGYTFSTMHQPEELQGEEALVQAAKADPVAFEPLYQHYKARIYRYLLLRIGSQEDAADLTQQVFLKAMISLRDYKARGSFAAWLFRIALHTASDTYRRKKFAFSWYSLPEAEQLIGDEDPESIFLLRERRVHLRELIDQLDERKRELIALRFSAGLNASEIAQVVGKSPAAVRKQLTRILQGLKEQL